MDFNCNEKYPGYTIKKLFNGWMTEWVVWRGFGASIMGLSKRVSEISVWDDVRS